MKTSRVRVESASHVRVRRKTGAELRAAMMDMLELKLHME